MSPSAPRVLIADDQRDVLEALRLLLKSEGYESETASSPAAALAALEARDYDAVLMDLNYARDTTSGQEGLDLLAKVQRLDGILPVVVMTAWGTVDLAVEAMRRGARDFVQKPWENARLLTTLATQIALGKALGRGQRFEAENRILRQEAEPAMIAESAAMRPVLELIERVAPSDANVLIFGENGTGKGMVARALHAASRRASRPLVTLNAGGISEGVFESELFGHVRGAFTDARADRVGRFELADGGTLFLDEIANLTGSQQAKILRVLETGEFERVGSSKTKQANVRILSATNADLLAEINAGRFREDLYFRLNTIQVHLPALRERLDDIPELARYFLGELTARYRKQGFEVSPEALQALRRYPWPGNIRELRHVMERAVLLARSQTIEPTHLGLQSAVSRANVLDEMDLESMEAHLIKKALDRHNGNAISAAKALGLSRSAFYRRLQKYQIPTTN